MDELNDDNRRPLDLPNPYKSAHTYIRSALMQHHREIGLLHEEVRDLKVTLRRFMLEHG